MPSNDRRIDTRMKIHLGGLLVKAGLDTLDPETLYGALLALRTARVKAAAAEGGGVPAPALTRDGWSGPSRFFASQQSRYLWHLPMTAGLTAVDGLGEYQKQQDRARQKALIPSDFRFPFR